MTGPPRFGGWREQPVLFVSEGERLFGVLCRPANAGSGLGALVVVGGPQYRAGSHRQFVHWARALATAGTPTLRFDVRGMGDSTGEKRPFTAVSADIAAAIQCLRGECTEVKQIVLCGLCDGASAALLYVHERPAEVSGLILLNPWIRDDATPPSTMLIQHYYLHRLLDRGFWSKLLRGGIARSALKEFVGHLLRATRAFGHPVQQVAAAAMPYQARMAAALKDHLGPVLLILSGGDLTAREFVEHAITDPAWKGCLDRARLRRLSLPAADHTFSSLADRKAVEVASVAFLEAMSGVSVAPGKAKALQPDTHSAA